MDKANHSLKRVITDYKEYIETTTKGPVVERAKVSDFGGVIVKEDQKVSGKNFVSDIFYTTVYLLVMCLHKCKSANSTTTVR